MKASLFFVALFGFAVSSQAAPPFEPHQPQKPLNVELKGRTVVVKDIAVGTYTASGVRALQVRYVPSSASQNMWDHIVEMYDVAAHFAPLAGDQSTTQVDVTPLIKTDGTMDTTYAYKIVDGVVTADWHLEYQPWFRTPRTADTSR